MDGNEEVLKRVRIGPNSVYVGGFEGVYSGVDSDMLQQLDSLIKSYGYVGGLS